MYRHFGADGSLLYIGISLNALNRLRQHQSSRWFDKIARVKAHAAKMKPNSRSAGLNPIRNSNRAVLRTDGMPQQVSRVR